MARDQSPRSKIQRRFEKGSYRWVLEQTFDCPDFQVQPEIVPFVIGALVFRGRMAEAVDLYRTESMELAVKDVIRSRFYLGIGYCRESSYRDSRRFFAENLRASKGLTDPEALFLVLQGVAFYRYFCGRYRCSFRAIERALSYATRSRTLYARVLAGDLKGHLLVQMGHISEGIDLLNNTADLASRLGQEGLEDTIRLSAAVYEAQFRVGKGDPLEHLHGFLKKIQIEDNYSRSGVLLELANQYCLRGQLGTAKQVLDQACFQIYSSKNRRQEALLNLRYAYLHFLRGDTYQALNIVHSARQSLVPEIDHVLELRLLGLEGKIMSSMGDDDAAASILSRIKERTPRHGTQVNRRILQRSERTSEPTRERISNDPVGDLIDLVSRSPGTALNEVLATGLYGLLREILTVSEQCKTLVLELQPGSITLCERGEFRHIPRGLTPLLRKLLLALQTGPIDKARIVQQVWGYDYHPLRHDSVLHSALSGLRKILGEYSDWIRNTEGGYRLAPDVVLIADAASVNRGSSGSQHLTFFRRQSADRASIDETICSASAELRAPRAELNTRQIRLVRNLKPSQFIGSGQYMKLFKVSEITASRDLAALWKQGILERVGKARATRYRLAPGEFV